MDQICCSVCGGQVFRFLGVLGSLRWYRCRHCDADHYLGEADPMDKIEQEEDACYAERFDTLREQDEQDQRRQYEIDTNYGVW